MATGTYNTKDWDTQLAKLKSQADGQQKKTEQFYKDASDRLKKAVTDVSEKNKAEFAKSCDEGKKCSDDRNKMFGDVMKLNIPDLSEFDPSKLNIPELDIMTCDPKTGKLGTGKGTETKPAAPADKAQQPAAEKAPPAAPAGDKAPSGTPAGPTPTPAPTKPAPVPPTPSTAPAPPAKPQAGGYRDLIMKRYF